MRLGAVGVRRPAGLVLDGSTPPAIRGRVGARGVLRGRCGRCSSRRRRRRARPRLRSRRDGLRLRRSSRRLRAAVRVRARHADAAAALVAVVAGGASLRDARRHPDRRWRSSRSRSGSSSGAPTCSTARLPHRLRHLPGRRGLDHGAARRLAGASGSSSSGERRARGRRRPRRSATSSAGAPTCSMPPTAAPARSARRSTSTRRSASSSASCAGSCRSSGWRSCSPRSGVARVIATAGEQRRRGDAARDGAQPSSTACSPRWSHAARRSYRRRHGASRVRRGVASSSSSACAARSPRRCSPARARSG